MTSEVREAAGRLRRVQAGEPLSDVYPDWKCETVWPYAADLKLLAHEHLAEHADDDELPIDEAWLRSVGFDGDKWDWLSGPLPCTAIEILMSDPPGHNKVSIFGNCLPWYLETRGQLRRLCAALGIPLQPIGQEQVEGQPCWFVEHRPQDKFEGWWANAICRSVGEWVTADPNKAERFDKPAAEAVAAALSYFPTPFRWSKWVATEHVFCGPGG